YLRTCPLPVHAILFFRLGRFRMAGGGEPHAHPGAPLTGDFVGGVTQLDASSMILDNAADDGEPKSGALLARRDIRLEQPAAIFLRQADPVIDDIDDDVAALALGKDSNRTLAKVGWWYRCNRFGRVLDEVGERLRHQASVEPRRHRIIGDIGIDFDFRIADTHQEHGPSHGIGHVLGGDHRLRHAREARELVDHPPYVVDLAHDGVRALLEYGAVFADHVSVFAAQTLGRQLNGSERILNLMRDAARHIRPCRRALCGDQFGDVVERHDIAMAGFARLLAGDPHRQVSLAAIAGDRHLVLRARARSYRRHEICEFRKYLRQWPAKRLGLRTANQFLRRAVEDAHAAVAVHADHARASASKHRFGEAPPAVDEVTRAHDVVALAAQFLRHAVKRFAELREIAFRLADRHAHMQVAGGNDIGGADQAPDRRHQTVGEVQSDPDRG